MKYATVGVSRPCTRLFDTRWTSFSAGGEAGVTAGGVHPKCCSPPAMDSWHLAALSLCPLPSLFTKSRPPQLCKRLGSRVCTLILQCTTAALMLNKGLIGFPVPTCTLWCVFSCSVPARSLGHRLIFTHDSILWRCREGLQSRRALKISEGGYKQ